jgi:hypothetical protein
MDPSLEPQFEQNRLPAGLASPQFEHVTSSMAVGDVIGGTDAPPEGGGAAGRIGAVGAGPGPPPGLADGPPAP